MSVTAKLRPSAKSQSSGRSVGLSSASDIREIVRHVEMGFPFAAIEKFHNRQSEPFFEYFPCFRRKNSPPDVRAVASVRE